MRTALMALVVCGLLSAAAKAAPPNVVLLSADTLRADHLGCYGYDKPTSPNLDALARDSVLFDDCICQVPLTNPSFGAVFSGQYPRTTGTPRNGLRMPDRVPLITEAFRAAGYETLCVQSNWTLKGRLSGLNRGFDQYRDDFTRKRWGLIKGERDAKGVTDLALELLARRDPAKPFFAWFHYSDPHAPYLAHKGFDPNGAAGHGARERTRARYDSEIAYMDSEMGRLLSALPRENTIIVFLGDHGESLYEHDYLGHGRRIYQDNLHVPLMVRAPDLTPRRERAPVRILDVAPTLLGLGGLAHDPNLPGRDLLREPPPSDNLRFVETYGGAVPKLPGFKVLMGDRPPTCRGVLHDGWKLIVGHNSVELYRLPDDPGELHNLVGNEPERVKELQEALRAWDMRHPLHKANATRLSPEDEAALQSLGYLE